MRRGALVLALALSTATGSPAAATDDVGTQGSGNFYEVEAESAGQGTIRRPQQQAVASNASEGQTTRTPAVRYEYRTTCDSGAYNTVTGAPVCPADPCPEGSTQYRQWQITAEGEQPMGFICSATGPPEAEGAAPPQVTDAMVLAAFRRVPVPELRSVSQPADKTLVNFETIFHAEARPFTEDVTILGQQVRLEIEPSSFRWEHGDGTAGVTDTAGAPYPAKVVVHRYQDAAVTVAHRVVVTWSAQWSLNGGPLQPVPGTVTTTGPLTSLRVAEAVPVLSGRR